MAVTIGVNQNLTTNEKTLVTTTITSSNNALVVGPVTISSGQTVTVQSGSALVIL